MPELPEAETIARGLRATVEGRRIVRIEVVHDDVLPREAESFRSAVRGGRIATVGRRGKNLVLSLEGGTVILVNLGMTGKLLPVPSFGGGGGMEGSGRGGGEKREAGDEQEKKAEKDAGGRPTHPALLFHLDDGGSLVYDDVRRFGRVEALGPEEWEERSRSLGPEPLDPELGPEELMDRLGPSRSPIRTVLLDQKRLAGVGNIYANEALHRARIHPRRPAESLDEVEFSRLHRALRDLLAAAVDAGGTTIRDYRDASGRPGRYSSRLRVYDREGCECARCGEVIERIVFGSRSAFLCPRCQPADPDRASDRTTVPRPESR